MRVDLAGEAFAAAHGVEQPQRLAVDVGQHQLRLVGREQMHCVPAVRGGQDVVAVGDELVGEERAGGLVFLDDQDQL